MYSWCLIESVLLFTQVGLLACWQGHFGRLRNGVIWKIVPPCLMWCIWKERNNRCFEDSERAIPDIKLLFFWTLLEWFSVWRNLSLSLLDLLDFCNFRSWFALPCILPVCEGGSFFFSIKSYYLSKKKKKENDNATTNLLLKVYNGNMFNTKYGG